MASRDLVFSFGALRCVVSTRGAELRSLLDTQVQDEYIWQRSETVWGDSAPILFPFVGRLRNGAYLHNGKRYAMPIHGFARHAEFSVIDQHEQGATLILRDSPETFACYPFRFVLRVQFMLEKHCLHVAYTVENPGDQPLLFSLGSHPGFRLPPTTRGLSDWMLAFSDTEKNECYRLDGDLLSRTPEPLNFVQRNAIPLSAGLFEHDALIFKQVRSQHVRLMHRSGRVRLSVATGGTPSLGLWARPGAPYVCIEPWHGYDDDSTGGGELKTKPGIVTLEAGGVFRTAYAVCMPPAR